MWYFFGPLQITETKDCKQNSDTVRWDQQLSTRKQSLAERVAIHEIKYFIYADVRLVLLPEVVSHLRLGRGSNTIS